MKQDFADGRKDGADGAPSFCLLSGDWLLRESGEGVLVDCGEGVLVGGGAGVVGEVLEVHLVELIEKLLLSLGGVKGLAGHPVDGGTQNGA